MFRRLSNFPLMTVRPPHHLMMCERRWLPPHLEKCRLYPKDRLLWPLLDKQWRAQPRLLNSKSNLQLPSNPKSLSMNTRE